MDLFDADWRGGHRSLRPYWTLGAALGLALPLGMLIVERRGLLGHGWALQAIAALLLALMVVRIVNRPYLGRVKELPLLSRVPESVRVGLNGFFPLALMMFFVLGGAIYQDAAKERGSSVLIAAIVTGIVIWDSRKSEAVSHLRDDAHRPDEVTDGGKSVRRVLPAWGCVTAGLLGVTPFMIQSTTARTPMAAWGHKAGIIVFGVTAAVFAISLMVNPHSKLAHAFSLLGKAAMMALPLQFPLLLLSGVWHLLLTGATSWVALATPYMFAAMLAVEVADRCAHPDLAKPSGIFSFCADRKAQAGREVAA